jgi:NitT/TauT family transport system permease protein
MDVSLTSLVLRVTSCALQNLADMPMNTSTRVPTVPQPLERRFQWGDLIVLLGVVVLLYVGVSLAVHAPLALRGPEISLAPEVLPYYAALSVGRMAAAYTISLLVALLYGRAAAEYRQAEQVLLPLLDVLQSIPILSFLPVVLLSFSAVLPPRVAAELAAIILIFTSQAWNLIFAWYQSLKTLPSELREASAIFHFNGWLRFRTLELPFAAISLIWNSMMSWAGGWFFLMAAEIFTVGERDFRLPGLGSYLQEAANRGDIAAIAWGLGTLVSVIVVLDQLVWRPLLAWSSRFKLEMVAGAEAPSSWFYSVLGHSRLIHASQHVVRRGITHLDVALLKWFPPPALEAETTKRPPRRAYAIALLGGAVILYGLYRAGSMLLLVSAVQWLTVAVGVGATLLRVVAALVIALSWTLPLGVAIGTRPHLAARVQPLAQIAASIPATALFPVVVLVIAGLPAGMNLAAVLLMLMGTQWYLLFNVIAGASAIPQDLQYTAGLLQLSRWRRWRILILPALFPYLITGAVTASGGAWNASIVAEYSDFAGNPRYVIGVGSLIARATSAGTYPLLLAATLAMIGAVVTINRLVWRRLYRVAEARYRLE